MLFNKPRAQEYMRRHGLDGLIATSPVNITYFTDYWCWSDPLMKQYMSAPGASSNIAQNFALFPLEGEPALVISPLMAVNCADLWVKDLRLYGDSGLDFAFPPRRLTEYNRRFWDLHHRAHGNATPTDALLGLLRQRGLSGARIGLEMEGLPAETRDAIVAALPGAEVKDCTNLLRLVRMVKTPEEMARLRRAAEIAEVAAMDSMAMARPGQHMAHLVRHYRARVAEMGADFDHFAFSIGGMGMATESDYVFPDDDLLFMDFGVVYQRYFSDTGMTLVVGNLPSELLARYAILKEAQAAALQVMRPGARSSEVAGAMWGVLRAHGTTTAFPHGHGVGLEIRDYPILVPDNGLRILDGCVDVPSDLPLEKDMVVNLEIAFWMAGMGVTQLERSFVVTDDGNRLLVPQERSAPVTAGV